MAQNLDTGGLLVTVGGWGVAILIALFTFVAQWRKGGVEETTVVLGKWKELVEAHENQIASLHAEINRLTGRIRDLEKKGDEREERIDHLEKENEGLKKQLRQQGESFASQLRRLGHNGPITPEERRNGSED